MDSIVIAPPKMNPSDTRAVGTFYARAAGNSVATIGRLSAVGSELRSQPHVHR
jgi:hypothetical protein